MNRILPHKKNALLIAPVNCLRILSCVVIFNLNCLFTYGQAKLLKDINLDEELTRNEYSTLTPGTGVLYFFSQQELWKTTGTPGGTSRLKSFKTINSLTVIGSTAYFAADDGTSGTELWKSNGTKASTVKVKDIVEGAAGSNPQFLTSANGILYFSAVSGQNGIELWRSDGTETGTKLLKDISPGSGSSNPSNLATINGTLYFSANDGQTGHELWKTDGTAEGTVMVKDIKEELRADSYPQMLTSVAGTLFFTAVDAAGRELWKSDGTTEGTVRVKDIFPGGTSSSIDNMTDLNGVLFFSADDGKTGQELWKSNGTEAGTTLVKDMTPGKAGSHGEDPFMEPISNFTAIKGALYYTAYQNDTYYIWRSDGTESGTVPLQQSLGAGINLSLPLFTFLNNYIYYFNAVPDDYNSTLYMWRMDLNGRNQTRIRQFYTPEDFYESYHQEMVRFNNQLFITGRINPAGGYELIKSSGTAVGTVTLKDAYVPTVGSRMDHMTKINDLVYFTAKPSNPLRSVFRTNGTSTGTIELKTLNEIYDVEAVNDKLFFTGYDSNVGWQLWQTAGETENTVLIKEQAGPYDATPLSLTNVNGVLFFYNAVGELYRSDGSSNGTTLVRDFTGINAIHETSGMLLVMVRNNSDGLELWKSDGTTAGTVRVKTIRTGTGRDVYFSPTVTIGDSFYFIADDGVHGNEVWRSNGTTSGTHLVTDLKTETDTGSSLESDIRSLGRLHDSLFISAEDNEGNWSLFRSNGTSEGTSKITNMDPVLSMVTGENNLFLFTGNYWYSDWANSLWASNGTAPVHLKDLNTSGEIKYDFIDDILYFNSESSSLKRSDGTACGTFDVDTGVEYPYPIVALGTSLIFGAYDNFADREPHVYDTKQAPQTPCRLEQRLSTANIAVEIIASSGEEVISNYPNPFKGDFALRVNGKANDVARVNVFTSIGVAVEAFENLECNKNHSVGSTWPPGIYIIKVHTVKGSFTKKIIKE